MRTFRLLITCTLLLLMIAAPSWCSAKSKTKKVYMSYVLHGNMNYDRYVRPTIWRDFPVIYNNLLDFMDEHPDFKGQVQFSGQTFKSLQQVAPNVIAHALSIHKRGQLNFTGTFYSEPVNVNMDGETNYRCAWLGTSIIEDAVGSTDGFYLQERAYHPQLPWILNHAHVSWVPVITGDDAFFPFKLKGMDGSVTTCVPITRDSIVEKIKRAPQNSLILIEEDYEIPQSFVNTYRAVSEFDKEMPDIEVEWITVKDYIHKYGTKGEHYVDHAAKAKDRDNGTYSRWTADPLDIIVQNYINHAMADFRSATIMNGLMKYVCNEQLDVPFVETDVTLKHDPLVWNIECANLYPDIEQTYLTHDGKVTEMTKAEHLLLWAVNSDAKGWNPLYEKRRERINSLENSSNLSKSVLYKGMDFLSSRIRLLGYDKYFMLFNAQQQRSKIVALRTESPYAVYDYSTGEKLKSQCIRIDGHCTLRFETQLPSYGYKVVALKRIERAETESWQSGNQISAGQFTLTADNGKVVLKVGNKCMDILLDSFKIKALAEITDGTADDVWRNAKAYGDARIFVQNDFCPQLRIEKQIDWLIHLQQTFTIIDDKILCDVNFVFPHPTLIRKMGPAKGRVYDPQGLTLMIRTHQSGQMFYDIPFGMSTYDKPGVSYFCPLSTCFYQYTAGGGLLITPQTGEQAVYGNLDNGEIGLYLGASTTSGPIHDVGLTFRTKTEVDHEAAWYSEPFRGEYKHQILLTPYRGNWKEAHLPLIAKKFTQPVYIRECISDVSSEHLPAEKSLVNIDKPNIEITSMEIKDGRLQLRMNEMEGTETCVQVKVKNKVSEIKVPPFGIVTEFVR